MKQAGGQTMIRVTSFLAIGALGLTPSCTIDLSDVATRSEAISDVAHTEVERQSIGNCWLYAHATWVESMHLAAIRHEASPDSTVQELDVSQSYWTYWHWFDQITGFMRGNKINTGGQQHVSNRIVLNRGLMNEPDFVPEDAENEMSARQSSALAKVNAALRTGGELASRQARRDGARVRRVLDEAWGLSEEVRTQLDTTFGQDGRKTLRRGGTTEGTRILPPSAVKARYAVRRNGQVEFQTRTLATAMRDWRDARFPRSGAAAQRALLERVQRALHDSQPVVITWNVDFNALENADNGRRGSFNRRTLEEAGGPGRQGGHMTVLEDYEAETEEFGVLPAGMTLDSEADAEMLAAALESSTTISLLRTKNSWGAQRADRGFAPNFPGYHDLWMDYLAQPFAWCPRVEGPKTEANCRDTSIGLRKVMLPPGY